MLSLNKAIKQRQKVMEKEIFHNISTKVNSARKANNNRLPHKYVENVVNETKLLCPWLTYNKVINYTRAQNIRDLAQNR